MSKLLAAIFIVVPIIIGIALAAALAGLWQGQWLGTRLRGETFQFRRNLLSYVTGTWQGRLGYFASLITLWALVRPITDLWVDHELRHRDMLVMGLPIIALGIMVGFLIGCHSAKPAGWRLALPTAAAGAAITWLLAGKVFPVPMGVLYSIYGFVLLTTLVNGFYKIRKLVDRPTELVTQVADLELESNRQIATELLKDAEISTEKPSSGKLKQYSVHIDPFVHPAGISFLKDRILIQLCDGFGARDWDLGDKRDPNMPGGETLPSRSMWLTVPRTQLNFLKIDHIIGHTETWFRLANSGCRLRVDGRIKWEQEKRIGFQAVQPQ